MFKRFCRRMWILVKFYMILDFICWAVVGIGEYALRLTNEPNKYDTYSDYAKLSASLFWRGVRRIRNLIKALVF